MAITIISQPAAIFPAYNPAPLVLKAGNGEEDVTLHFKIDGVAVSTHKREFFALAEPLTDNFGNPITDNSGNPIPIGGDLLAVFDLGRIARDFFSNALVEVNAVENAAALHTPAYIDRRLCVPFTAEITGVSSPVFTAVNAAMLPGLAEADYSAYEDKFLTEFSSLLSYAGYSNKSKLYALLGNSEERRVVTYGVARSFELFVKFFPTSDPGTGTMTVTLEAGNITTINFVDDEADAAILKIKGATYTGWTSTVVEEDSFSVKLLLVRDAPGGLSTWPSVETNLPTIEVAWIDYRSVTGEGQGRYSEVSGGAGRVVGCEFPVVADVEVSLGVQGVQTQRLIVLDGCIPSAPFYVRWVNRIGGREHWMFARRQSDKMDTDNSVTYEPRIESNDDLGKDPRQIGLSQEHTVVFGAEGVPNAEFDVLRRITVSPVIEWWDESITEWRVITIKSGATSKDTSSPVQSIELEFTLPAQALQF